MHQFVNQSIMSHQLDERGRESQMTRVSRQEDAPYADVNEPALGEQLLEGLDRVVAAPEHGHGHRGCKTQRAAVEPTEFCFCSHHSWNIFVSWLV